MNFKGMKTLLTAACAGVALLSANLCLAGNVIFYRACGSSAMIPDFKAAGPGYIAGFNPPSVTVADSACTFGDTTFTGIPDQTGTITVIYGGSTANSRSIAYYINLDSGVGLRAYFNFCTLKTVAWPGGVPNDVQAAVLSSLVGTDDYRPGNAAGNQSNGNVFNVAMSDVTPDDGLNATINARADGYGYNDSVAKFPTAYGVNFGALYGAQPAGVHPTVKEHYSATEVNIVPFSPSARPATIRSIIVGATPVVVIVNTAAGSAFNNANVTDVRSQDLQQTFNATFTRTSQVFPSSGLAAGVAVRPFLREPISGTYVTYEQNIMNVGSLTTTQESGILATNNPLYTAAPAVGGDNRSRVIGTGSMVNRVKDPANTNGIGYAFFSNGTFVPGGVGIAGAKYVTVDGVDGLNPAYGGGAFAASPPFTHIIDGSYPIFTELRAVADSADPFFSPASGPGISGLIGALGASGNFVPASSLIAFHSHYQVRGGSSPDNGIAAGTVEAGATAGGRVFFKTQEINLFTDTGFQELISLHK